MAKENQIEFEIVLDDGSIKRAFATVRKDGKETSDVLSKLFNNPFRVDGLADLTAGLFLVREGALKLKDAFKAALDTAILGEKIGAAQRQFEGLALSAGLSADSLKLKFQQAADGLVSDSQLVEIATAGIAKFGKNAERLPEVLELARKASAGFGGTVEENFEKINNAISSYNLRSIKMITGTTNADQAFRTFAGRQKVNVEYLSDQTKQQILLNEVLEKGNKKLKDVDLSLTTIADNAKRADISFHDLYETFAKGVAQTDAAKTSTSLLASALQQTNASLQLKIDPNNEEAIKTRILFLQQSIEKNKELASTDAFYAQQQRQTTEDIKALNEQLELAKINREDLIKASRFDNKPVPEGILGIANAAQKQQMLDTQKIQEEHFRKLAAAASAAKESIQASFKQGLVNIVSAGAQRIGASLLEGKAAFDDFGRVVLGIIGDMAIQIGSTLVGIGFGIELLKASLIGLTGGPAIAAGLALIAIGGLLKSLAGNAPSGATGNAAGAAPIGGAGGIGFEPSPATTPSEEQKKREVNTEIVFNVHGDILDGDETGLRMVSLLNDAFDKKGVVIRRGLIA